MMLDRGSVKKVVSGVLSEIAANIGHDFFYRPSDRKYCGVQQVSC